VKSTIKLSVLGSVFLIGLAANGYAQSHVRGRLVDSTQAPVPFSAVGLMRAADSSLVIGSITNEKGEFDFTLTKPGTYLIKANSAVFGDAYFAPFKVDSLQNVDLPDGFLTPPGITMNEVSVVAIKKVIEFKDGMIVMNVEDSPLAYGNSVFELLRRLPGVSIDSQNNIRLNGKGGVRVMLDGRMQQISGDQLAALLGGMSADLVSRIEVINNPPPRYDAEGISGLINIVTKKVKVAGLSGNISGNLNQGEFLRGNLTGSLNYKAKKGALFSNFNYMDGAKLYRYRLDRSFVKNDTTSFLLQSGSNKVGEKNFFYKVGGDYYPNKKTTLGFFMTGLPALTPSHDQAINRVDGYNNFGYNYVSSSNQIDDISSNSNYNINAEHIFDTLDTKLKFSADYFSFKQKKQQANENYFMNDASVQVLPSQVYASENTSHINIFTQTLDFNKKLKKDIGFEAGAKNIMAYSNSEYLFKRKNNVTNLFDLDTGISNNYSYKENIIAGYFNFQKPLKHGSLRLGGRGENTTMDSYTKDGAFKLTRRYFNFFPYFSFDYSKSNKHSFQFNLSTGINRPSYTDLNPNRVYSDYYTVTSGNPYLQPQKSYYVSVMHQFNQTVYNTFGFYHTPNYLLTLNYQEDSTKLLINTIANIKGANLLGHILYIQKDIKPWWNFSFYGLTYFQDSYGKINGSGFYSHYIAFEGSVNNDIILPGKFKLQVSGFYYSPQVYGLRHYKNVWELDLAIQKKFLNDRLSINLSVFDVFQGNYYRYSTKFQSQDQSYVYRRDTRRVAITASFKFGKVKVQDRTVSSSVDEQNRVNSQMRR
jgi:iron complex outermembrane receptor protein